MQKQELKYFPVRGTKNDLSELGYVAYYIVSAEFSYDGKHLGNGVIKLWDAPKLYGISENWKRWSPRESHLVPSGIAKYRDGLIPKQVHEDLASGKCKYLILDYSMEGYNDVDWDYISTIMGVEKSKLVWVTGIWNPQFMNRESEVSVCFTNFWEEFTFGITKFNYSPLERAVESTPWSIGFEQQLKDIDNRKKRKYYGLSYNRQPRIHRAVLLTRLKEAGVLTNTSYSWGKWATLYGPHTKDDITDAEEERKNVLRRFDNSVYMGLLREQDKDAWVDVVTSDEVLISDDEDLTENKAFNLNFNHISDCYFQIVSETWVHNHEVDDATPFLSEKSYKPFICAMPFVMWGQKGTIQALRDQGYSTFDSWINHDYDNIVDDGERLTKLLHEIERLYSLSHDDWTRILKEMKPELLYNYQEIYQRVNGPRRYMYKFQSIQSVTTGLDGIDWRWNKNF